MSIVNEALKKVNLNKLDKKTVEKKPAIPPVAAESTPQINITNVTHSKTPYIIIAVVGSVAILTAFLMFGFFINNNQSNSPVLASNPQAPLAAGSAKASLGGLEPPQKEPGAIDKIINNLKNRTQFQLNGIVYSDVDPTAIINDTIVREGDQINGATIESIQENFVKLSQEGKEITLEVK